METAQNRNGFAPETEAPTETLAFQSVLGKRSATLDTTEEGVDLAIFRSQSHCPMSRSGNRDAVLPVLEHLSQNLDRIRTALQESDVDSVRSGLGAGVTGRSRIPGKHGGSATSYTPVTVVIDDAPGALARLLVAAGEAGVNVEDLRLEHSPGQPVGLVELAVRPEAAAALAAALTEAGWRVHADQRQ